MDEDYARKLRAWLRAEPEATPRQAEEEREWLRDVPAPHPDPQRWTVRGQLPATPPEADDEWVCPVIELPVPRSSKENGCRMNGAEARSSRSHPSGTADQRGMSEAEAQSRRNHPSGRLGEQPAEPRRLNDAEARSRWNHPSNWHRRRREEQALPHHEEREPGSH